MNVENKRSEEKRIMEKMMHVYCHGQRHGAEKGGLCGACAQLLAYSHQRTEKCPHMQTKTFCSKCPAPCYMPEKRAEIKAVMRYAGVRMLWHSPVLVLRHVLAPRQAKGRKK